MNAADAVEILNNFSSADAIASYLQSLGVKGYREDETSCPIATWMSNMVGRPVSVSEEIRVYSDVWNSSEAFEISKAVKIFITDFDAGYYEYLEKEDDSYPF